MSSFAKPYQVIERKVKLAGNRKLSVGEWTDLNIAGVILHNNAKVFNCASYMFTLNVDSNPIYVSYKPGVRQI